MLKIGVLGYGTVGAGVVEVLERNRETVTKRAGQTIEVKYVLDLLDFPGNPIQDKIVHDIDRIANDEEIQVVVETMGGVNPAYSFVRSCLENGKSVCTSNKELVATHGAELLALAEVKKVNFLFEASVGGGIPIIRPLNQSLTADEVEEITGILNGTTNYILTKMANEGLAFDTVLKEAQELGYAERNPSADVDGFDAGRKIAILTSLAYGSQVDYEDVYTEGISEITAEDFLYAKAMDTSIKLFGSSVRCEDGVYAMVSPVMINSTHPLFSVNDVFNGIYVKGNMLGDVMFYGKGAGKLPTASAVVSDVIDATKHLGTNIMTIWTEDKLELMNFDDVKHRFFVRAKASKEQVAELFGIVEEVTPLIDGEYVFVTPAVTEKEFREKAAGLPQMITRIRVAF